MYRKSRTKIVPISLFFLMMVSLFITAAWNGGPGGFADPSAQNPHPDFNGDGFADLAIGVPSEDLEYTNVTYKEAGAVHVVYGTANGLDALSATAPVDDQLLHRGIAGLDQLGIQDWDSFGKALTTGNFNGDKYDDLAIGVPNSTVSGVVGAGAVHVVYGSDRGLDLQTGEVWAQDIPFMISGVGETWDAFGKALTAGDFNDDGFDDLVVGSPDEDVNGDENAGAINIIYGTANGLNHFMDEIIHQDSLGFLITSAEEDDFFGQELTVADFDNDGIEDLAVGTPREDFGRDYEDAGIVFILFGSEGHGLVQPDDSVDMQPIRADTPGVDNIMEADDLFGHALAAADFNDDGFVDLAIGSPGEDHGFGEDKLNDAGAINIVFGSPAGLDPSSGAPIWHQGRAGMEGNPGEDEEFGFHLEAGEFNGDGYADLVIAVPYDLHEDIGPGYDDYGRLHIMYGDANGPSPDNDQLIEDPAGPYWPSPFGWNRSFGLDVNGDAILELAVGVSSRNPENNNITGGVVYVFSSDFNGISTTNYQTLYQGRGGLRGSLETGDGFGWLP
ncbi:hypothetical protein [Candidatus Leptofilum sp.]|uniref:hypothetical protein n=1 Tax=Candidatus Leptofilum sp. TaxID=3241576 RepID=UPI003B59C233